MNTSMPPSEGFPQARPNPQRPADSPGFPGAVPSSESGQVIAQDPEHQPGRPGEATPSRQPWTKPEDQVASSQSLRESVFSRAARHGDPGWIRAWRSVWRLVINDPYPEQYSHAVAACQQPVTTGRRIGVISPVGGAGRSTLVAALSLLFSSTRTDHIAAADLSGRPSGLAPRLVSEDSPSGLKTLAHLALNRNATGLGELQSCSALIGETLHRTTLMEGEAPLTSDDVAALNQAFSRTCAISVMELPLLPSEHSASCLQGLHALILAVPPVPSAAEHSYALLELLQQSNPMLPLLPVLVNTRRAGRSDQHHATRALRSQLRAANQPTQIHTLSHDRHLGLGEHLRLTRIGEDRRLQLAQIGAAALTAAQGGRQ